MKTTFYATLLLICFHLSSIAQEWHTNFTVAKEKATRENKNIVLVFAGSDWCAPCIKLDKKILQTQTFKQQAKKNWVLMKADFPKLKKNQLSESQTIENNKLAEKYNINGYFPFVVLLSPGGKLLGETSFSNQSPEAFIETLNQFEKL